MFFHSVLLIYSRPGIVCFGLPDVGQQILLPKAPLPVTSLTQLDRAWTVSPATCDIQPCIPFFIIRMGVCRNCHTIGLCRCIVIIRRCAGKVGERKIGAFSPKTVLQERNIIYNLLFYFLFNATEGKPLLPLHLLFWNIRTDRRCLRH